MPNSQFPITDSQLQIFMIDREEVRKVANLARLELTPEEEEQFTSQLNGILDYFEQLSELDTSNVEPTTRAIDVSNVMRSDDLQPFANKESILQGAPDRDGEFFKVPKIM
jgi:aspartyl-tRNA(Asn)/glutamyl-tRNA(Gln) amidotransferase subunit C